MCRNLPLLLPPAPTKESLLLSHFLCQQKKPDLNQEPFAWSLHSFSAFFLTEGFKAGHNSVVASQYRRAVTFLDMLRHRQGVACLDHSSAPFGTPFNVYPRVLAYNTPHQPLLPQLDFTSKSPESVCCLLIQFLGKKLNNVSFRTGPLCSLPGTKQPSSANKYPLESRTNQSSSYLSFLFLCLLLFCW